MERYAERQLSLIGTLALQSYRSSSACGSSAPFRFAISQNRAELLLCSRAVSQDSIILDTGHAADVNGSLLQ